MKIIQPSFKIETPDIYFADMLQQLEKIGRVCYKSEDKITATSANDFVKKIIANGHEAIIEHAYITVRFIWDRGVTHELVRHRLANYAQESSRYCCYSTTKNKDIQLIHPVELTTDQKERRETHYWNVQTLYELEISEGLAPQIARGVLPTSLKTEIIMTANLREWRHVLKLRTSKAAHPQIRELMIPLQAELHRLLPLVF